MLDLYTRISALKRPPLLARAARFGVDDYRRHQHLRKILKCGNLPRHGKAIIQLLDLEAELESWRRAQAATYRPARHVEVLIALLGEAHLMRTTTIAAV